MPGPSDNSWTLVVSDKANDAIHVTFQYELFDNNNYLLTGNKVQTLCHRG